jgi:hypothetical protein
VLQPTAPPCAPVSEKLGVKIIFPFGNNSKCWGLCAIIPMTSGSYTVRIHVINELQYYCVTDSNVEVIDIQF